MSKVFIVLLAALLCGCSQADQVAIQTQTTASRTAVELPTTTPVPALPTPTFVPTAESTSPSPPAGATVMVNLPTDVGKAATAEPTSASVPLSGKAIRFEDTTWVGGWRNKGDSRYKGRTATWIYGANTAYNTMRVTFTLSGQPTGQSQLQVEGMDSEGDAKTPILVKVNGQQIFRGPNPLPNDQNNLPGGTWGLATFPFSSDLLQPGSNTITIQTLVNGQFGLPPFFMLDYADLVLAQ